MYPSKNLDKILPLYIPGSKSMQMVINDRDLLITAYPKHEPVRSVKDITRFTNWTNKLLNRHNLSYTKSIITFRVPSYPDNIDALEEEEALGFYYSALYVLRSTLHLLLGVQSQHLWLNLIFLSRYEQPTNLPISMFGKKNVHGEFFPVLDTDIFDDDDIWNWNLHTL